MGFDINFPSNLDVGKSKYPDLFQWYYSMKLEDPYFKEYIITDDNAQIMVDAMIELFIFDLNQSNIDDYILQYNIPDKVLKSLMKESKKFN